MSQMIRAVPGIIKCLFGLLLPVDEQAMLLPKKTGGGQYQDKVKMVLYVVRRGRRKIGEEESVQTEYVHSMMWENEADGDERRLSINSVHSEHESKSSGDGEDEPRDRG